MNTGAVKKVYFLIIRTTTGSRDSAVRETVPACPSSQSPTETKTLRNLKKLVICEEVQALLEAQDPRRNQAERLVRAGGTGVGQVLGRSEEHHV